MKQKQAILYPEWNEIEIESPDKIDFQMAIVNFKNNTSPGCNNLQAELIKYG